MADRSIRVKLTAAITDTTTETFSVSAAHAGLVAIGELWEHDDDSGEQREITDVDVTTPLVTGIRGSNGSTAVTHLTATYLIKEPRFTYNLVTDALDQAVDNDLYPFVYEIVEHQVTSNAAAAGNAYNAPSANCEQWLDVYQRTVSTNTPTRGGITYTVYPQNVDTALWATGKVFEIYGGKADGTEKFYVNCAHRIALSTLIARQETLVKMRACQYLLEWTEPRRVAGPTNQGDRTIRAGAGLQTGAYYEQEFRRHLRNESTWLKNQRPPRRVFKRAGAVTYATSS